MVDPAVDLNVVSVPLNYYELFGRSCPVCLDAGCGKGKFLVEVAQQNPAACYIGIERSRKYFLKSRERVMKHGVENVRLILTTMEEFVYRLAPPAMLDAVYFMFPDPWPKKRHRKRRFFKPENLDALIKAMKDGALLLVKTDFGDYAEEIRELLRSHPLLVEVTKDQLPQLPESNFERKYRLEGRTFHTLAAKVARN